VRAADLKGPLPGLDPGLHACFPLGGALGEDMGGRNKSGHGELLKRRSWNEPSERFNLWAIFWCRFAADSAASDLPCNFDCRQRLPGRS
jgi:hypothetical protein